MKTLLFLTSLMIASFVNADETRPLVNVINFQESIDKRDLKLIMLGVRPVWNNGVYTTIVLMPLSSPQTVNFMQTFVGMAAAQYFDIMQARLVKGDQRIIIVKNEDSVIERVSKIEGAIGYVNANSIAINYNGMVKILRVL